MAKAKKAAEVEAETQEIGRSLWDRLERRTPTLFERRWWDDQILSWAMSDESVKVQMFRFVDVLPMLRTHEQVTQHLQEYFDEVRQHLPSAVRIVMDLSQPNSVLSRAVAWNARKMSTGMARRFIAGSNVEEVLRSVGKLRKQGFAFTLDLLGEAVVSEREAEAYQQSYVELIDGLCPQINSWPEAAQIDRD
ncbi:MAG: L-glutamate gamma-semialdehyde dehydrogenase, partial [Planctomycetaceae bacterium]|nr:L-glutamate gamma-semialdehyde dehydrogenase [Planctomycetaceae bacterium]